MQLSKYFEYDTEMYIMGGRINAETLAGLTEVSSTSEWLQVIEDYKNWRGQLWSAAGHTWYLPYRHWGKAVIELWQDQVSQPFVSSILDAMICTRSQEELDRWIEVVTGGDIDITWTDAGGTVNSFEIELLSERFEDIDAMWVYLRQG